MKKYDYYVTIDKKNFHIGFAVGFAGDKISLTDRYYVPVSKKIYDEIYKRFVLCTCYHEPFEVKND